MTGSSAVTRPLAGWTSVDLAAARALVDVGLPVRDDDHPLAVEVAAQRVLEPLRRPQATQAVRSPAPTRGARRARARRGGTAGTPVAVLSPRISRRSSLLQPRHERRAATTVMIDAASARKPKASTRNRVVVASRRSTKLRSWTRTTNPRGRSPVTTGIAVAWTRPPGTENTDAQVVQATAGEPASRRTSGPGARTRAGRGTRSSGRAARGPPRRPPRPGRARRGSARRGPCAAPPPGRRPSATPASRAPR